MAPFLSGSACCVSWWRQLPRASAPTAWENSLPLFNNNFANAVTLSVTVSDHPPPPPAPVGAAGFPFNRWGEGRTKELSDYVPEGSQLVSGGWDTKVPEP